MDEGKQMFYTTGLDALCEAANFVEDVERNFHGYARPGSPGNNSNDSNGPESRERRRNGGREIHNQLEKTRRAQMKDHFNALKKVVPSLQQKKHSNQSILKLSQKYIQTLMVKDRKYQQEIQELARKRAALVELFRKKSEDFEQAHGFPVKAVLENTNGEDNVDEVSSISTKSAEEVANMKDFDDEEAFVSIAPPPPPHSNATRGIPHPVICETPLLSQRQHPTSTVSHANPLPAPPPAFVNQAIPQATVKKLHAKLTSTKQAVPPQGGTRLVKITDASPQMQLGGRPAALLPPALLPPALLPPAGSVKIPIPSQFRPATQSLLSQIPQRPNPTFTNARPVAGGFLVSMANQPAAGAVMSGAARLRFPGASFPLATQAMVNSAGQLIATGTPLNLAPGPLGAGQVQAPAMITVQSANNGQYLVRVPQYNGQQPMMYLNSLIQSQNPAITTATNPVTTKNPAVMASAKNPVVISSTS